MKKIAFCFLIMVATISYAAGDDQLVQETLKKSLLLQASKVDVSRFQNYSSRTQLKLNLKASNTVFAAYTSIDRVPASRTVNGQALSGDVTVSTISGNAGTATALAANGTNCSAGQAALGVDASGNSEGCWSPMKTDYSNAGTAPTWDQNTTGTASGIESWTTATLLNSWVTISAGYTPKYRKNPTGLVTIAGAVKNGTTGVVLQLPVGYRPAERRLWVTTSSAGFVSIYVDSDGTINVGATGTSYQYLDGSFYAE